MAYSNRDVRDLNEKAREYLKGEGKLEKEEKTYTITRDIEDDFGRKTTLKEERAFSKGDRIVFTRNKGDLGVSNGSMGTILSLKTNKMTVLLDNGKDRQREVTFAPKMFSYFDQGYAVTIHKSQGTTVDKSFVLASHEMNQNLTYVAMTRHREDVHVYGSSLDFWRKEKVAEVLSKSGDKLGAADYLDARSLASLMKEEDRFLEKIFIRVSDELQAMGAVTKQAFEKVATRFFGWDLQKERSIFVPPEILREEQRAKDLLYGGKTGAQVSYGHSSEPEQGRTPERTAFIDAGKTYVRTALTVVPESCVSLTQESEKMNKPYEEEGSINKAETKKDSLGEDPQEGIQALYMRFKEVRAEMARHLHSPPSLIDERNSLGYAISQDKEFMAALKAEDKKAFYLVEDCASKHIFYNQHEKEGLSL